MVQALALTAFVVASALLFSACTRSGPSADSTEKEEPVRYSESPILRGPVERGELPPVEERLPKEPLVVTPVDGPGRYDSEAPEP